MPFSSKHKFFYRISFKSVWPLFILECVCWGVEGSTLLNFGFRSFLVRLYNERKMVLFILFCRDLNLSGMLELLSPCFFRFLPMLTWNTSTPTPPPTHLACPCPMTSFEEASPGFWQRKLFGEVDEVTYNGCPVERP